MVGWGRFRDSYYVEGIAWEKLYGVYIRWNGWCYILWVDMAIDCGSPFSFANQWIVVFPCNWYISFSAGEYRKLYFLASWEGKQVHDLSWNLLCRWYSYEHNVFLRMDRHIFQVTVSVDFCLGQILLLSIEWRYPFSIFCLISFPLAVIISDRRVMWRKSLQVFILWSVVFEDILLVIISIM